MQCAVVNIGGYRIDVNSVYIRIRSLRLLLVPDIMLGTRLDAVLLDTLYSRRDGNACKVPEVELQLAYASD